MKVLSVPCFSDNYAWLLFCEESGEAAVVDPSDDGPVLRELDRLGATLTHIFCTHHHNDHVEGIAELKKRWPQAEVFCCSSDLPLIPGAEKGLEEGDSVNFCGCKAQLFSTPGHTQGGICYLFGHYLFTGDTLFGGGCGRLFGGEAWQMKDSLEKFTSLDDAVLVCCGHEYTLKNLQFAAAIDNGNVALQERLREVTKLREEGRSTVPSTLGVERRTNPFLRCAEPSLITAVQKKFHLDTVVGDPSLAVFIALRRARDTA
ncbi:hydroxyacylglutathione hydrolase [Desulforhopalus vacuolatus]|uniref:hydroxyacylglutathione hydrolase n=1 Tax=Desulforhopalus vacuolatus TaxID=40414 RepID=UPI001966B055|nr:hydroxyacylglutathione hydrolase [Desulforhopalus vacuolatus]MBM9518228.1 hydroxyacylglutathione hydrolase [Desulforhopalus vacuolatus]